MWSVSGPLFMRLSYEDDSEAGMLTMAVGHIVHADQAEAILQDGKADLIALARELLYSPNWALDAAQKLGADPDFTTVPPAIVWWLGKRAKSAFEGIPSTYKPPADRQSAMAEAR